MESIVVIQISLGNIPGPLHASVHHQAHKGRRLHIYIMYAVAQFPSHPEYFPLHLIHECLKGPASGKAVQHIQHHCRKGQAVDIGDIHPCSRDDEFPAGRHGIIASILRAVTQFFESRDNHVIVGILREAKPLFGQLGSQFID